MIPTDQIIEIVTEQFPECKPESGSTQIQKFETIADFAISLLDNKNHNDAKRLFLLMEELALHVDPATLIAIENVFIYRLGTRIECDHKREQLRCLLPESFRATMIRQFTMSNI